LGNLEFIKEENKPRARPYVCRDVYTD